jgi:hypothetical protein
MRIRVRTVAILAGLAFSLGAGAAGGPGRPSFGEVAAQHRGDPWRVDPCAPHRPVTGICRMLRPVSA